MGKGWATMSEGSICGLGSRGLVLAQVLGRSREEGVRGSREEGDRGIREDGVRGSREEAVRGTREEGVRGTIEERRVEKC